VAKAKATVQPNPAVALCQGLGLDPDQQWRHIEADIRWDSPASVRLVATWTDDDGNTHTQAVTYTEEAPADEQSA
jgi:hypothetical protein